MAAGNSVSLLRSGLLCTVAASVILVAEPYPAHAVCDTVGSVATCTGDEEDGIQSGTDFLLPPVETLNVNNLDAPGIAPPTTDDGINFTAGAAQDITINSDTSGTAGINTTGNGARGIFAYQTGGDGDISVTSTGSISTDGTNAEGIYAYQNGGNGKVTVTSTGTISTMSDSADGIDARQEAGNGAVSVTSVGNITTTGSNSAKGITATQAVSDGAVSVSSTGDISTMGTSSEGIFARNFGGTGDISVTSKGDITTIDDFSEGISAEQDGGDGDVSVISKGDISTMGETSEGIFAEQTGGIGDISVTSTGSISTDGTNAEGINAYQNGGNGKVTVTSTGTISTMSEGADGIDARQEAGNGAVSITSVGNITTNGNNAAKGITAIQAFGDGAVSVSSTGDISTVGTSSEGIFARNFGGIGDISVTSKGDITTIDDFSEGIAAEQDGGDGDVSVISKGNISTMGATAEGIFAEQTGGNGNVTISSEGNVYSALAEGISAAANGIGSISITHHGGTVSGTTGILVGTRTMMAAATVDLHGGVIGTGGTAINFQSDGNDVLNLNGGASITGTVDFGNSNAIDFDTLNALPGFNGEINFADAGGTGQGDSDLESAPEEVSSNIAVINSGLTAVAIDPTGFAASGVFLSTFTSTIFNSIDNKSSSSMKNSSAQEGSETYSGASEADRYGPHVWLSGFAGRQEVGSGTNTAGLEHDFGGLMLGAERSTESGTHGIFGGFGMSNLDVEFEAGDVDISSMFGGAYWKQDYGTHRIHMAFVGGMANHESRRNLGGAVPTIAEGDYDGWFFSPSVTLAAPVKLRDVKVVASVRASYAAMFMEGYEETGTVANPVTVSERNLHMFNARAQLAVPQMIQHEYGYHTLIEWRTGLDGQFDAGSENVDAAVGGAAISFSATLDEQIAGFIGASLTMFHPEQSFAFTASGEFQSTLNGGHKAVGEVRASMQF